jgi:integrase
LTPPPTTCYPATPALIPLQEASRLLCVSTRWLRDHWREDVDFTRRQVRLWTRKKSGGNLTPRLVDMNDMAAHALKFAQWHRLAGSPHVFPNPHTGKPYDYRDKFFDRLCRLAGVPDMGYHALRHAKASQLADQGESLPYIRDFLGHESISTTSLYLASFGAKK